MSTMLGSLVYQIPRGTCVGVVGWQLLSVATRVTTDANHVCPPGNRLGATARRCLLAVCVCARVRRVWSPPFQEGVRAATEDTASLIGESPIPEGYYIAEGCGYMKSGALTPLIESASKPPLLTGNDFESSCVRVRACVRACGG